MDNETNEPKRKRGRPKKKAEKEEIKKKMVRRKTSSNITEDEARLEFCTRVRDALEIDYIDTTIADSMTQDDEFISDKWKGIGGIVMPFVAGGVAMEGPQTTVRNAFVIGYYLGSLKSKHSKEIEYFNKKFGIIAE
jgi:hypothetical protein